MTTLLATNTPLNYPSGDGRPVAETFDHLYAILVTLEVLRQYLDGQQATVLANQFLYYAPGVPSARVAPDLSPFRMVAFLMTESAIKQVRLSCFGSETVECYRQLLTGMLKRFEPA